MLLDTIGDGIALLAWEQDAFAFAESYDDEARRYRRLCGAQVATLPDSDAPGLLVEPDVARKQLDAESKKVPGEPAVPGGETGARADTSAGADTGAGGKPHNLRRQLSRSGFTA